ncbi:TonB-dependent receptor domain-containing protein [Sphingopyxis sp.]|uniref:TonB-dependent receptor domain-containing protein n=1 Tax=Sphingopyxis sp. TaxID=1908224 RepID=UPI003D6CC3AA
MRFRQPRARTSRLKEHSSILDGARYVDRDNDPIWGVKLDAIPIEGHRLELTYFDTGTTRLRKTLAYDAATDTVGGELSQTRYRSGGTSYIGRYTGNLTDWFTVSGAYGVSKERFDFETSNNANFVRDELTGAILSDQKLASVPNPHATRREFYRFDADLYVSMLGEHHIRFGMDTESNRLNKVEVPTGNDGYDAGGLASAPGGVSYYLNVCGSNTPQCVSAGLAPDDVYVGVNYGSVGGGFKSKNRAFYLQDEWRPTANLTLNLGVRLDQFASDTLTGQQWLDLDSAWAPRLGASYDVFGDGRMKLFGNYGRYFLPVASNTAFIQFGQPIGFTEYWQTDGTFGAGNIPNLTSQITNWNGGQICPAPIFGAAGPHCNVIATGALRDTTQAVSQNLKPSEEDEIILGASYKLDDRWTIGLTYTRRRLLSYADDISIDAGVVAYCRAEGVAGCVLGCPYEGEVALSAVVEVAERLAAMGCYEISLGDTIGAGTPAEARDMVRTVARSVPSSQLAIHFHDSSGRALDNARASLEADITVVDSAIAGLGGCPYAPGSNGNLATEALVGMLDGLGLKAGSYGKSRGSGSNRRRRRDRGAVADDAGPLKKGEPARDEGELMPHSVCASLLIDWPIGLKERIDPTLPGPLHSQIIQAVIGDIERGHLASGGLSTEQPRPRPVAGHESQDGGSRL